MCPKANDNATTNQTNPGIQKSVISQLALLRTMSMEQLREKWKELFGTEPPQYKCQFMIRRLAYRIQELYFGGLPQSAKNFLNEIARTDLMCLKNEVSPSVKPEEKGMLPGTRFVRFWNGIRHEVMIHDHGFEYNSKLYRSLSAIAREITGTRWNGKVFFGIKKSSTINIVDGDND